MHLDLRTLLVRSQIWRVWIAEPAFGFRSCFPAPQGYSADMASTPSGLAPATQKIATLVTSGFPATSTDVELLTHHWVPTQPNSTSVRPAARKYWRICGSVKPSQISAISA